MRKNVLRCDATGAEFQVSEAEGNLVGFIIESDGKLTATTQINHVDIHFTTEVVESIHSYEVQRLANLASV